MSPTNPDPNGRNAGKQPGGAGTTKQKVKEDAREVKREVGAKARKKAEAGQHRLAEEADALSDAIDAAAANLDDHDRQGLARYARELSGNLAAAAGQLEGRSVDELASDAKRLARDNPALFMLGSIAVGFGLSRFFKASAKREHHHDDAYENVDYQADAYRNDDTFRDDDTFLTEDFSTGTPERRTERDSVETLTSPAAPRSGEGREML